MNVRLTIKTAEDLAGEARTEAHARIAQAVDGLIEAQAQALQYKSAAHLAGYASSTVPQWAEEARAFIHWRDQVWLKAFDIEAQHRVEKTIPTPEAVLAALPVWRG